MKKQLIWKKLFGIFLTGALLLTSGGSILAQASTQAKVNSYSGIVIDEDCSSIASPGKHTKACSLMPGCIASGFGIDIKQADGTWKFFKFDTNGHSLAKDYLYETSRENNLKVIVTGTSDGKTIKVTSLKEDLNEEYTGILIDADCSGTASPGKHTKACSLMPGCIKSGFGIDVKQADGTWKFIKFDARGQKLAKENILDKTKRESNLTIVVQGILKNGVLEVASITEDIPAPVKVTLSGWLEDVHCSKMVGDPAEETKECLLMKNCAASGYGIIVIQSDYSYKYYTFDAKGNKLAAEFLSKTSKDSNITILVSGLTTEDKIQVTSIDEEQELLGIITTKALFEKGSDPAQAKRDEIVSADSEASGYGIATKQADGKYKFYQFEESAQKTAKSILSWYVKWGENISSIPVLAQGVIEGNTVKKANILRERPITGQLATKKLFVEDKPLKDITREDLLTTEGAISGYGYYVHSCGGHEFFPFDEASNTIVKEYIQASIADGKIKAKVKGFWYWKGKTIKVTGVSADPEEDAVKPEEEELKGVVATRSYFKGDEYQKNGAPGKITKDFLLASINADSGYGIIYKTCCRFGYLRFDENGARLAKDFIKKSKGTENLNIIVKGTRNEDTLNVTSIIAQKEQTYAGALVESGIEGYGIKVGQSDGESKFYKFDFIGSYYHDSGQLQAEELLKEAKKDSLPVNVKGTENGNTIIVSSIEEVKGQTFDGYIQDKHCFGMVKPELIY
jgi:hypothetical protein